MFRGAGYEDKEVELPLGNWGVVYIKVQAEGREKASVRPTGRTGARVLVGTVGRQQVCHLNASDIHPNHRFAIICEPMPSTTTCTCDFGKEVEEGRVP